MPDGYDVFAEQDALRRRQQLLQAMQSQAMQRPIQGKYGLAQALAKIGEAYLLKGADTGLKGEQAQVNQQYQSGLQDQMAQFMRNYEGEGAIKQFGATPEEPSSVVTPATEADPRAAIIAAMTSQYPEMQQMGKTMMPGLFKEKMTAKDIFALAGDGKYTPESVRAAAIALDPNLLKANPRYQTAGDRIWQLGGESTPQAVVDAREHFTPLRTLGTNGQGQPIVGATAEGTNKPVFAPAGQQINVDTGGEKAFAKQIGIDQAGELKASYNEAKLAASLMPVLGEAQKAIDSGIKSGAPAEFTLGLAKWAKALGIGNGDPSIANTDVFRAAVAQQTFKLIKNLGAGSGISDADREFAEKAALGKITLDNAALRRGIDIAWAGIGSALIQHHELLGRAMEGREISPGSLMMYKVPFNFNAGDRIKFDAENKRFSPIGAAGEAPKSNRQVRVEW